MTTTTPWRAVKGHKWCRHSVTLETNGTDYRIITTLYVCDTEPIHTLTRHATDPTEANGIYKQERRFIRNVCPYELADAIIS